MASRPQKKKSKKLGKAQAKKLKPKRKLAGSAVLVGDLEAAGKQLRNCLEQSLEKTAREL